jgi:hypothetical protein
MSYHLSGPDEQKNKLSLFFSFLIVVWKNGATTTEGK